MEIFGLTLTGYSNYISAVLREGYKEPVNPPNLIEILDERLRRDPSKSFNEVYNKLDPIIGTADGFSYGSYERLRLQRKKGLTKPVGPTDMYRVPPTRGQEHGFWMGDRLLKNAEWTKPPKFYGSRSSDVSKPINQIRNADPFMVI